MSINDNFPWATFTSVVLTVIFALVGGAVVIWGDPGALSFDDYMKSMAGFAVAQGFLGIGRGIKSTNKKS